MLPVIPMSIFFPFNCITLNKKTSLRFRAIRNQHKEVLFKQKDFSLNYPYLSKDCDNKYYHRGTPEWQLVLAWVIFRKI